MITRVRTFLVTGILVAPGLLLAGCGQPIERAEGAPDLLFVQSDGEVSVIHSATGAREDLAQRPVPSRNWSTMVRVKPRGMATRVEAIDPLDQSIIWAASAPGRDLEVRLVAENGIRALLGPVNEEHFSRGRSRTRFVVVGDGIAPKTLNLKGNIEPEAFSTDGGSVFVLSFTPARRPASYQVLKLDLSTGEIGGVYTPDAELQESMQGTARTQAVSPDGRFLYTLYTTDDAKGHTHSFVHVLNLEEEWAHCIDLPEGVGLSREGKIALAVTPDGDRLYLADTEADHATVIDTRSLSAIDTFPISVGTGGKLHALAGPAGELLLAEGREVQALEPESLAIRFEWTAFSTVHGMQVSSNGTKLYVGLSDRIKVLDLSTGELLGTLNALGSGFIESFGPVLPTPLEEPEDLENFTCAC